MRVGLAFPGCHRRGGVERVMFECAGFLAARGHDVTVHAAEWEPDPGGRVAYVRVPCRRWPGFLSGPSFYRSSTRQLADAAYDVLNTHGCVCPTGGVHWVQSVHKAWLESSRRFRPRLSLSRWKQRVNPAHPILLRLEELHFRERCYRKVIATTETVRADLGRYYDVPPADVVVLPNGFSPSEFNPSRRRERREQMRDALGLKQEDVALLFVANELDRKGYDTILRAMRRLGRPELKLLHIGRPAPRTVTGKAERLGLGRQVVACGSSGDVAAYHAAADAFVLPTQYEAFCLAILEALGSGLPVVTSDVPGARDAIRPGLNGLLVGDPRDDVELANALERMLDPRTRDAMSGVAPATVEQFQWPVVLAAYERLMLAEASGR